MRIGDRLLDLSRPRIMGVVNVTPDSFSDGGRYTKRTNAIRHGRSLAAEGADIIDIGGESTRPGSSEVSVEEELRRIIPVIQALKDNLDTFISVDTSKVEVMVRAAEAGADLVNDVNALRAPGALDAVAELKLSVCLMHMQGVPKTMQRNPSYRNVVIEVRDYLADRVGAATAAGITKDRICIDPGFGFGKNLQHNLKLLRQLGCLRAVQVPIVAGLSRKSMIATLTGSADRDRTHASVALALAAYREGATILRVHDVQATHDALTVWQSVYPS